MSWKYVFATVRILLATLLVMTTSSKYNIGTSIFYLGKYFRFQTLSKYLLRFLESIRLPFNSSATCLATFFRSNSTQPSVKCLAGLFFKFAVNKKIKSERRIHKIKCTKWVMYYGWKLAVETLCLHHRIRPTIHAVWLHSYTWVSTTGKQYLFFVFSLSNQRIIKTQYRNCSL